LALLILLNSAKKRIEMLINYTFVLDFIKKERIIKNKNYSLWERENTENNWIAEGSFKLSYSILLYINV